MTEKTAEELAIERGDIIPEPEEDEKEDQPGAEAAGADEEEEEEEPISIPKARFDEVQRRAREHTQQLENRIRELETGNRAKAKDEPSLTDEIEALTISYEDLLLDGEVEKARVVRRQRDAKQAEFMEQRVQEASRQTGSVAVDQMRFDAQLAQFEALYPAINPDAKEFDTATVNEVNELLQVFRTSGLSLPAALSKAVSYVFKGNTPVVDTKKADDVRNKRGETERKRVAGAAKKMPPSLNGRGRDSDKAGERDGLPDITRMTPEQFDKLTPEQLSILRQDRLSTEEAA
mgnify:CR=1 FL=1